MVRKYEPVLRSEEYGDGYYATWRESKYGQFVRLSTYVDVTAQLNAEIARLKKQLYSSLSRNQELPDIS